MLGSIRIWGTLVILGAVVSLGTGAYFYVTGLQEKAEDYRVKHEKAKVVVKSQNEAIKAFTVQVEMQSIANKVLQEQYAESKRTMAERNLPFQKHDVARLMEAKPNLMTKYMQRATIDALKELEEVTR